MSDTTEPAGLTGAGNPDPSTNPDPTGAIPPGGALPSEGDMEAERAAEGDGTDPGADGHGNDEAAAAPEPAPAAPAQPVVAAPGVIVQDNVTDPGHPTTTMPDGTVSTHDLNGVDEAVMSDPEREATAEANAQQ